MPSIASEPGKASRTGVDHGGQLLVGADDVRWDAVALGALGAPFAQGVEEREVGVQDLCPPRGVPALGLVRERGLLDRWPKAVSDEDCQVRHSVSDKEMISDRKDLLGSQQLPQRRVVEGLEHRVKTQRQHARQHVALTHNHPPPRARARPPSRPSARRLRCAGA